MKMNGTSVTVGMAMQAMIAGTMAVLGIITLGAGQQLTAGFAFVIIVLAIWAVTKRVNSIFVGMAMQAFIAGLLANFNLITLVPAQQFTAAGIFLLIALAQLTFRK